MSWVKGWPLFVLGLALIVIAIANVTRVVW